MRALVDSQPCFNRDGKGIRASVRVLAACDAGGDTIDVEEADWALLRDCAESPDGGYPVTARGPARATFQAMIDAITGA